MSSGGGKKDWKPYTVPYTGGGAVQTGHGWVPSAWMVGPGIAQSPNGQVFGSGGTSAARAAAAASTSHPDNPNPNPNPDPGLGPGPGPGQDRNQNIHPNCSAAAQTRALLNLAPGVFSRAPDPPK